MIARGAPIVGAPPAQAVMELGWAFWATAVVQAAAKLRIADSVAEDPIEIGVLAQKVGADADALARLMRALVGYGIFRQDGPGRYAHTESSLALRSDDPGKLLDIMLTGGDWSWRIWSELAESVRTGTSAFLQHYGKDLITYFMEDDPEAGLATHRGYSAQALALNPALVASVDLTGARTVVDVGGGHGTLLRALLEHNPWLDGVLFDSASVLKDVDPALTSGPLAERARLVDGDCLREMPLAADVYVFRQVLHMWDDDTCLAAMRNCVKAARDGGRVVLFEQLVADPPENPFDALMDLHMLLVMGGRERTADEYARFFERSGMTFDGVVSTGTPLRLLQGTVPSHRSDLEGTNS